MSDPAYVPRAFYDFTPADWVTLHLLMKWLPKRSAQRHVLLHMLARVELHSRQLFAKVVWSEQDIREACARARGLTVGYANGATWEDAGILPWDIEAIMDRSSYVGDAMTAVGWEVLEEVARAYLWAARTESA